MDSFPLDGRSVASLFTYLATSSFSVDSNLGPQYVFSVIISEISTN